MSIRRAQLPFEGQYVQIPNAWMRDNRLSHRARGLLAEIMTHSPGWVLTQSAMWRNAPEGREAIRKTVAELVKYGYLAVDQERGEFGRFGEVNYVLTAPDLAEVTATQKLGNGRKTGARSTAPQESDPKEDHLQEDQSEREGAPAPEPVDNPVPPTPEVVPWCKRHAATEGTDLPCTACARAKTLWSAVMVADSRSNVWQATGRKLKLDPAVYCEHGQFIGKCETCAYEERKAAEILTARFGDSA